MMWWTCRGCEAKDMEISRLVDQVRTLTDRLLIAAGKPESVSANLGADEPDEPTETVPTKDEFDREAQKALEAMASERGLDPGQYADA